MCSRHGSIWIICAALLVTLALSACGGGDRASSAGTSSASSSAGASGIVPLQQFIDHSKAVCRKWRERVNKGFKDLYRKRTSETGEAEGSVGTIESMRVVVVPAMRRQLAEMEAVGLPKENAYAAERFWDAIRRMTNEIESEGIFAWTRESTIFPIHNLGKQFQLQNCVYF
jgi:hypothetical protein